MPFENGNTITGWGVMKSKPWHLAGIFQTREEAEAKAAELGEGYAVRFGENLEGSGNFIWKDEKKA